MVISFTFSYIVSQTALASFLYTPFPFSKIIKMRNLIRKNRIRGKFWNLHTENKNRNIKINCVYSCYLIDCFSRKLDVFSKLRK